MTHHRPSPPLAVHHQPCPTPAAVYAAKLRYSELIEPQISRHELRAGIEGLAGIVAGLQEEVRRLSAFVYAQQPPRR